MPLTLYVLFDLALALGLIVTSIVVLTADVTWKWKIVAIASMVGLVVKATPYIVSDLLFSMTAAFIATGSPL